MAGAALTAALVHGVFLGLFHAAGVEALALLNVFCTLLYLGIAGLMWRGLHGRLCEALMCMEVLLHAVLATWWLGWDGGFHLFLLSVLPVLVVSTVLPRAAKWLAVGALVLLYLGLDLATRGHVPAYQVPDGWLPGMRLFNEAASLMLLAGVAALYYRLVLRAEAGLREMASIDPLTGLLNRRSLLELVRHHVDRLAQGGEHAGGLCLLLGDIDHFKAFNDQHGHEMGDQVLRAVSLALQSGMRQGDLLGRWGGEEFLVLLPGTELSGARMAAERLRALVQARELRAPGAATVLPVSISFGLSRLLPGESFDQAVARADQALSRAKQAGRNRVAMADTVLEAAWPRTRPPEEDETSVDSRRDPP